MAGLIVWAAGGGSLFRHIFRFLIDLFHRPLIVVVFEDVDCAAVLRDALFFMQRTAEKITQQNPVDAGMRDKCGGSFCVRGGMSECGICTREPVLIGFAAGRTGRLTAPAEVFGITLMQLVKCQAIPFAAVKLNEFGQNVNRTCRACDGLRRLARAKERTGIYGFDLKRRKMAAKAPGLCKAQRAQRKIILPAEAHHFAAGIVWLRMANEINHFGRHGDKLLGEGLRGRKKNMHHYNTR